MENESKMKNAILTHLEECSEREEYAYFEMNKSLFERNAGKYDAAKESNYKKEHDVLFEVATLAKDCGIGEKEIDKAVLSGINKARVYMVNDLFFVVPELKSRDPEGIKQAEIKAFRNILYRLSESADLTVEHQLCEDLAKKDLSAARELYEKLAYTSPVDAKTKEEWTEEWFRSGKESWAESFDEEKNAALAIYQTVGSDKELGLPQEKIGPEECAPYYHEMKVFMKELRKVSAEDLMKNPPTIEAQMKNNRLRAEADSKDISGIDKWEDKFELMKAHTHIVKDVLKIANQKEIPRAPKITFSVSRSQSNTRGNER